MGSSSSSRNSSSSGGGGSGAAGMVGRKLFNAGECVHVEVVRKQSTARMQVGGADYGTVDQRAWWTS